MNQPIDPKTLLPNADSGYSAEGLEISRSKEWKDLVMVNIGPSHPVTHGTLRSLCALDGETIVLCEVKSRRTVAKGTPEEAVTPAKRRRYAKLAQAYLLHAGVEPISVRFDVITLLVIAEDRALLRHLRAAFVPE